MIRSLLVAIVLLFAQLQAEETRWETHASGGFSAEVSYPSKPLSMTEQLPVTLKLTFPSDYHINAEGIQAHLQQHLGLETAPFRVINSHFETQKSEKQVIETYSFILDPQDPGKHHFSFWTLHFEPNESSLGKPVDLLSDMFTVTILETPLTAPMVSQLLTLSPNFPIDLSSENRRRFLLNSELQKAEQARNVEIFKERKFPWIGLLALTFALGLVMTSKKRSTKPEKSQEQQSKDAKESAFKRLKNLEKSISSENYEQFYVDLTDTLHTFIEEYYHIPADTRTTEEFMQDLKAHPLFDSSTQESLQKILDLSDRIKFGHLPTNPEEGLTALKLTREFIKGRNSNV